MDSPTPPPKINDTSLQDLRSQDSPSRTQPRFDIQHGTFIANLEKQSPTRQRYKSTLAEPMDGTSFEDSFTSSQSKSSKVIESLHQKIDTLTNTNLQLTYQSNNLLTRLEEANLKQSKHIDTINKLKLENGNLSAMYERKSRKAKEMETQLEEINIKLDKTCFENENLNKQMSNDTANKQSLEEQLQMSHMQYQALQDAQARYKQNYESQIEEMQAQIFEIKMSYKKILSDKFQALSNLDSKWEQSFGQLSSQVNSINSINKIEISSLNKEMEDLKIDYINNENLSNLYSKSKEMAFEYAELIDMNLPDAFKQKHNLVDGSFTLELKKMEALELQQKQRSLAIKNTENMLTSTPTKTATNITTFGHTKASENFTKNIPLRNNSGNVQNSSNANRKSKRNSSFYGSLGTYVADSDTSDNSSILLDDQTLHHDEQHNGKLSFSNASSAQHSNPSNGQLNFNNMSTKEKRASWLASVSNTGNTVPSANNRSISPFQNSAARFPSNSRGGSRHSSLNNNPSTNSNPNKTSGLPGLTKNSSGTRKTSSSFEDKNDATFSENPNPNKLKRAGSVKRRY
ncbi:hypothetical protein ACO0RG_003648 [Hanseniaspora osmophila]